MILRGLVLEQRHGPQAPDTERFDNKRVGSKDRCEFKSLDSLVPWPSRPPGVVGKECAMEGLC